MSSCPMGVKQVLEEMRANWPQANLDAAEVVAPLYRCRDLFYARSKEVIAEHGLTFGEFEALAMLRKMPAPHRMTPSEICKAVWLTSGGMTKALNGLEKAGLISRQVDPVDRRSRIVELTADGKALVERIMAAILARHDKVIGEALSPREREQFVSLISKLVERAEAA